MKLSTTKIVLLFLTIMCLVVTKVIASHKKRHHCDDDDDDCDWDDYEDYDDYDSDDCDDWEHRGRNHGYESGMPSMPGMPGMPLTYTGPRGRETAIVYPTTGVPAVVTATYSQVGSTTYYPGTGQVVRNSGSRESSSASFAALTIIAIVVMALNG